MKKNAPKHMSCSKAKQKIVPISGRMNALRGKPLTSYQKTLIAEFIVAKTEKNAAMAFEKGFKASVKLDELQSKLDDTDQKGQRAQYKKTIRRLENELTPGMKRAAIKRHREINALAMEYFRLFGAPDNIRHFIKWLQSQGAGSVLNERTLRDILSNKFGIKGKPGRIPD
jgi:hypothetical protein